MSKSFPLSQALSKREERFVRMMRGEELRNRPNTRKREKEGKFVRMILRQNNGKEFEQKATKVTKEGELCIKII